MICDLCGEFGKQGKMLNRKLKADASKAAQVAL